MTAESPGSPTVPSRRIPRWALIVGALAAAIALFFILFDWNWLKGPIERRVSAATGRRFEIQGNLSGQWSLHPLVRMEGVRFANPAWAQDPEFLSAQRVEIRIGLLSLLHRPVHILDLGLDAPALSLERAADGRSTWQFDHEQKDPGAAPVIDRLTVSNGDLRYRDAVTKADMGVHFETTPDGGATRFSGGGTFRAMAVKGEGRTAPLLRLQDLSAPLPLAIKGSIANTGFSFDGSLKGLTRLEGVDAQYSLQGSSLKELGVLFAVPLPETPPYRIAGHLNHAGDIWESTDLTGRFGNSDVAGNVRLTSGKGGNGRPLLETNLDSKLLDLADLGPLIGAGPPGSPPPPRPAGGERLFPTHEFDLSRVDRMDAHVVLKASRVVHAAEFPFDNFLADFTLRDSHIHIEPLQFGMADGQLRLAVDMDAHTPMKTHVQGRLRGIRVARIFPVKGAAGEAAGTISGYVDLSGTGNSVAAMMGSADGRAAMVLNGGRVPSLLPAVVDLDGARILTNFLKGTDPENITCTAVDLKVDGGTATPNVAVVETETTVLTLGGTVNFADETAQLRIEQAPKKKSILSLRTPITVSGPLRHTRFGVAPGPLAARSAAAAGLALLNPLAALFALIETGPGEDGTCAALRQGLRESTVGMR